MVLEDIYYFLGLPYQNISQVNVIPHGSQSGKATYEILDKKYSKTSRYPLLTKEQRKPFQELFAPFNKELYKYLNWSEDMYFENEPEYKF